MGGGETTHTLLFLKKRVLGPVRREAGLEQRKYPNQNQLRIWGSKVRALVIQQRLTKREHKLRYKSIYRF